MEEQLLYCSDLYLIPRPIAKARIKFLLDRLGLEDRRSMFVEQLSGGMQKRLNLAITLVHSPRILVLDEPTANLDIESKEYVRKLLNYLVENEKVSILCSSHDLDEIANLATEVIFMNHGKILYREVKSTPEHFDFEKMKEMYTKIISKKEIV
jgi:ABC-2 type transport system ATP-binding protein